ncbi:MAG: type II toxin-antitoxin system RelE/ParE family toxin [Rhodomicrobiaceae bacterium]
MPGRKPLSPKHLQITDTARADIQEIIGYLASEAGTAVAETFLRRIDAELTTLAELGHSGVSREWISPGLRLHVIGNYCVYFRCTEDATRIIRLLNAARDINAIAFEALSKDG